MKIGILTYHFSDNFGAVLQAYALRKWFIDQGHEAEFLNYHPGYVEDGGEFIEILNPRKLRANLKILYLKLSSLKRRLLGNAEQANRFKTFREQMLGVTGPRIETLEALEEKAGCFDMLVAGSDQIWNPSDQRGLDPAYFLSFASDNAARRISYAASFGKDFLPVAYHKEASKLLNQLDSVSVRENSGVDIVKIIASKQANCVPDPTFLLDDYSALTSSSNDDQVGHIFCYALRTGSGVSEVAEIAARNFKTHVISPYNVHRRWREIGKTVFPGPSDWLKQILSAKFVVTNSFHGTVFAILFKKPFIVVGLPGKKEGLNARAKYLLNQLDLSDRFIDATEIDKAKSLINKDIDWSVVEKLRLDLKKSGVEYLEHQIELVSQK